VEEARAFPRRDLELAYCDACGFVFNHVFDEAMMGYSTNFEESQHFSGTFNAFAKELARETAQRCAVSGKHVLEIGCGKGEFLRELCRTGGATGLGIDPGYRADEGRCAEDDNVQFITDFFSGSYKHLSADVILCRHTLEHRVQRSRKAYFKAVRPRDRGQPCPRASNISTLRRILFHRHES
jgi:2-polyprenyl-3-methyl-5-hydroxy-6-metoxy-1,4-benzoquinol methylase